MSLLRFLKSKAAPVLAEPRADDGLPLRARIGSVLTIDESVFRIGTLVIPPTQAELMIVAISRIKPASGHMAGCIYRYYLTTGDTDGETEKFLQIAVQDSRVVEIEYFSELIRHYPQTREEWDIFTGANGCGIGESTFSVNRGQMPENLGEVRIQQAFSAGDELVYHRQIGDGDFEPPLQAIETRVDDSGGEHGLQQKVIYMPYARAGEFFDGETLLVSTEILKSEDGLPKEGAHVDFMVGLPVRENQVCIA